MKFMQLSALRLTRLGISGKFILAIAVSMTLLATLAGVTIIKLQSDTLAGQLNATEQVINTIAQRQDAANREAIDFKARQLSGLLAAIAPQPMVQFDLSLLGRYANMAVSDPDVSYVAFLNPNERPFAQAGNREAGEQQLVMTVENEGIVLGSLRFHYNYQRAEQQLQAIDSLKSDNFNQIVAARDQALRTSMLTIMLIFCVLGLITIVLSYALINRLVRQPLSQVVNTSNQLAAGNLTARVNYRSQDEVGHLAQTFNAMADAFQGIIRQVASTANRLRDASEQMSEITGTTIRQVKDQHRETEQVATAMTEMAATVEEVARNTAQAAESASHANDEAGQGKQIVYATIESIKSLADEVEGTAAEIKTLSGQANEIGSIIDVIQSIAEQTNLLALNAAIEAARAGEQGRGFAVVADEVRTLAQRTQASTREIEDMISRVQAGAKQAASRMDQGQNKAHASVEQAKQAGASLDTIAKAVALITEMTTQIASAAEEQSAVANDMHRHITLIRDLADKTAGNASLTETSGQALMNESDELGTAIAHFKV